MTRGGGDGPWQDLRYGIRALWRAPGFVLTAVLILSAGTGLNLAFVHVLNVPLLSLPACPAAAIHKGGS